MALQIGDRVGDYEILAKIGAGGMGQVFKVKNIFSNREEAMKVLLPDLTTERDLAARFMMEIRTLATMDHPNIAQLRTAFQFENQLVMIMEFVEGVTLEKLAGATVIPIDRELDFATQVLSALSFAHEHGVIHRDIKPANIMITIHGQVKLMDFGIAKNADEMHLTRPGMTIGSVYYMSPEQVRGGTVDARSDLYSFGITMYESLTGRKPFEAETSYSVLHAQCNTPPIPPIEVNPNLTPELNAVVLRALAKDPNDRYQTAKEFHDAVKALITGQAADAAAVPVAPQQSFTPVPVAPQQSFTPVPVAPAQGFTPVPASSGSYSATAAGYAPVAAAPAAAGFTPVMPPGTAPVAQQAYAPVSSPSLAAVPAAQPKAAKSHRGLWIGLGALAAILALVAVAFVGPRMYATFAKQKAAVTQTDQTIASSATPAAPQPSTPPPDATPQPTATPAPAEAPGGAATPEKSRRAQAAGDGPKLRAAYAGGTAGSGNQGPGTTDGSLASAAPAPPPPMVPAGPSRQEIRQARDRLMNLEARADAAREGVQSLRRQQQAQGFDMRGDILATLSRLNNDLRQAHTSLEANDLQSASEYTEHADHETASLEKFLGR
jgi:serine/threonine-protein kinase